MKMYSRFIGIGLVAILASGAFATTQTVTNDFPDQVQDLPRDKFYAEIQHAMHQITAHDLVDLHAASVGNYGTIAISTNLYNAGASAFGGAVIASNTVSIIGQATLTVAPKMTEVTTASTMTEVVATNMPVCVASNAPLYWKMVIGTQTGFVKFYQTN